MILVTGSTGLLGNTIVRELLFRDRKVRVLCRTNSDRRALAGLDIEIFEGDLQNAASVELAVAGCSAVIHCGAFIHIGWNQLDQSRKINVEGTRHVVEASLRQQCRLIHVSTVDTLPAAASADLPINETSAGRPKAACAYVVSKTEAEAVVLEAARNGLDAVVVNPGFMLGPFDWKPSSGKMMIAVARAPILVAPGGGGSVCDSRDVARAVIESVERGRSGEKYILAGENLTYQKLWQEMLLAIGTRRRVYSFPIVVSLIGKAIDCGNRVLRLQERTPNGAEIAMGGLLNYYDSSKAQRELDYRCRPLEATLDDAWKWLQEFHGTK